jgi:hypothetical protein
VLPSNCEREGFSGALRTKTEIISIIDTAWGEADRSFSCFWIRIKAIVTITLRNRLIIMINTKVKDEQYANLLNDRTCIIGFRCRIHPLHAYTHTSA